MDLSSTNGSFLNGERLEAGVYYRLKEADTLRCVHVLVASDTEGEGESK